MRWYMTVYHHRKYRLGRFREESMLAPINGRDIIIRIIFKLKSIPCSILLIINSIVVFGAWITVLVVEWLVCKKCMQHAFNAPTRMRAIVGRHQQIFMQLVTFLASIIRAAYCYLFFTKKGIDIAHERSFEHRRLLSKLIDFFRSHGAIIA